MPTEQQHISCFTTAYLTGSLSCCWLSFFWIWSIRAIKIQLSNSVTQCWLNVDGYCVKQLFFTLSHLVHVEHFTLMKISLLNFLQSSSYASESISFVGVGEGKAKLLYRFIVKFQGNKMWSTRTLIGGTQHTLVLYPFPDLPYRYQYFTRFCPESTPLIFYVPSVIYSHCFNCLLKAACIYSLPLATDVQKVSSAA